MATPGTINHAYSPNDEVYVIDACNNNEYVKAGTVIRVRGEVLTSGTTVQYDIRFALSSATYSYNESDVFPDKTTALAEYANRI